MDVQHHVPTLEPYLSLIRSGKKQIEGRVFSPRYQKVKVGDLVRMYNQSAEIFCRITRICCYPTFKEMLLKEGLDKMVPNAKTVDEAVGIYRSFEGFAEKEKKFGAVAFGIELIS